MMQLCIHVIKDLNKKYDSTIESMLSYFFTAKKVEEPVLEKTVPQKNELVVDNEKLKAQVETLLAEKEKLEKTIQDLKRESAVYRDLMFTKVCLCNSHN